MPDFRVQSADYARAARAMRGADAVIRREFSAALRKVAKPVGQQVLVDGAAKLPKRGGLSARVAGAKIGVQAGVMKATVSLKTKQGYDLKGIDAGIVRHPVFERGGRKKGQPWKAQAIDVGVFSDEFDKHADEVRDELLKAGDIVLNKIQSGGS